MRVYTPRLEEHGWRSQHSVVEIADGRHAVPRRFRRDGAHPARNGDPPPHPPGRLRSARPRGAARASFCRRAERRACESLHHVEIDRGEPAAPRGARARELEQRPRRRARRRRRLAGDARARARDRRRASSRRPPPLDGDEVAEATRSSTGSTTTTSRSSATASTSSSLTTASDVLRPVAGSGLGILRDSERKPAPRTLAAASAGGSSARPRAEPAQPDEGELARDRAPACASSTTSA